MQLDFQDVLFDLEKSGELYQHKIIPKKVNQEYKLIGSSGQTRFM